MEPDNPLLEPMLALLHSGACWKLHDLMQELKRQQLLPEWPLPAELALFRTNFLLMNGLYQLQRLLWPQGWWLDVVPLALQLQRHDGQPWPERADPLASYYLDWTHCLTTSVEEVQVLLDSFWRRYGHSVSRQRLSRAEACRLLEVDEQAPLVEIRRSWKRLALCHHPDRQGDVATFLRLRQAWEYLRDE